jgi:hypothetical protein
VKVSELIEQLSRMNPDAMVVTVGWEDIGFCEAKSPQEVIIAPSEYRMHCDYRVAPADADVGYNAVVIDWRDTAPPIQDAVYVASRGLYATGASHGGA